MTDVHTIIARLVGEKRAFVCYKKPGKDQVHCLVPGMVITGETGWSDRAGFIMHPFSGHGESVFYACEEAEKYTAQTLDFPVAGAGETPEKIPYRTAEKNGHIYKVEQALDFIARRQAEKIVLSHRFVLPYAGPSPVEIFGKLLHRYTGAFVYMWYHPRYGMWWGATPERLLTVKHRQFQTMALAGTSTFDPPVWREKEIAEHRWVSGYIAGTLKQYSTGIHQGEMQSIRAGHLYHLQTAIRGELVPNADVFELVQSLHPTPAVCGMPKEKALDFILKNEAYPREFYTGFLGEWKGDIDVDLFVNLRCVQLKNNRIYIYAGGGIVEGSRPAEEWEEILQKARVMSSVL